MKHFGRRLCSLCVLLCGLGPFGQTHAANFVIVARAKPQAEIIVQSERPEAPLAFAAEELQRYVKEMTGVTLPIGHGAPKKFAIVLSARSSRKDPESLADPREEDHYRLNIQEKQLQIEGASPRAVLFGVYDLLERLGCGWCVPGDDSVPKRRILEIPQLQVDTRPAFEYRVMLDFPLLSVAQTIAICDWLAKNRMNWVHECPNAHGEPTAWYERRERVVPELRKRGLHLLVGGHTMHTWLSETNFDAHPEWFAYNEGKRKPRSLCLANVEMTEELIKHMQRFLNRCPEVEVIDLWHPDGTVFCHCAKCTRNVLAATANEQQTNSPPADAVQAAYIITYIEFINRVAIAIAKSHPGVMIGPLIYSQTDHAIPDNCPAPAENVLVGLAHFFRDSYQPLVGDPKSAINLRFLGNDLTWMAKSKHFYIYEYYNAWIAPYIYPGAQVVVEDLRMLQKLQVRGVSSDLYGYSPVNMYVAARALWSPAISWEAAVRDFCLRYYGEAGEEMATNEVRLEKGIFGRSGYQASGARDPEKWEKPPESGLFLQRERPEQIRFLETLIKKSRNPLVQIRLERALKPWSLWNKEPRFWAFPDFKDSASAPKE